MKRLLEWIVDNRGKFIALIIATLYLIAAFLSGDIGNLIKVLSFLLLPLGCIFFGDAVGGYAGSGFTQITKATPGCIVVFLGWILLFLPVILFIIVVSSR